MKIKLTIQERNQDKDKTDSQIKWHIVRCPRKNRLKWQFNKSHWRKTEKQSWEWKWKGQRENRWNGRKAQKE